MVYQINTLNAVTSSLFLINILCVYMHYIFLQKRFFVTAELYLTYILKRYKDRFAMQFSLFVKIIGKYYFYFSYGA